jgi:hypothetical protein
MNVAVESSRLKTQTWNVLCHNPYISVYEHTS